MNLAFRAAAAAAGMSLVVAPAMTTPAFADQIQTTTPIQHLVVIFQENVSFDHYFGTYPFAANTDGTKFNPVDGTPSVNGLGVMLLSNNPNAFNPANDGSAVNPFRLRHSQATTCDQDHDYADEQEAFDLGLMDVFPTAVGNGSCGGFDYGHGKGLVMGYFDGNTTTALWNYAQKFAMSDNSYGTTFGPSSVGALNLAAGQTGGVIKTGNGNPVAPGTVPDNEVTGTTVVGDPQPYGDACSTRDQAQLRGPNIGDLLNAKGISWGFFEGGFDLTKTNPNGTTGCNRSHPASGNVGTKADYIPHHEPFQYYTSTANLAHTRPSVSPAKYGTAADTGANHQYDSDDFFDALAAGNLPAVSFLKAPGWQDGHAGYSDPLLEQVFIVNTINALMKSKFWKTTAIVISYDDSDGWYDHQMGPIVNPSSTTQDKLTSSGKCGNGAPMNQIQGRCGYGPRLPLIVVSPWAKVNYVDHTTTDQSSIIKFVEDNWSTGPVGGGSYDAIAGTLDNMFNFDHSSGDRRTYLDPVTGN
jgi:phospholipase C